MLFKARPTSSIAIICPGPYPVLRRYIFFEACISLSLNICAGYFLGRVFPCVWVGPYFVWKVVTLGFACNCKASYFRRFFEISIALLLGLVGAPANGQGQEAAFSHCRWRSLAIFRRILRRADFAIFEVKKKISHISRNWIA